MKHVPYFRLLCYLFFFFCTLICIAQAHLEGKEKIAKERKDAHFEPICFACNRKKKKKRQWDIEGL